MDALRERIDAHKLATKDTGGKLSFSEGQLPKYTSIGTRNTQGEEALFMEDQGAESPRSYSLRKCRSCDSPLSPKSPPIERQGRAGGSSTAPPATAPAAAAPAATSHASSSLARAAACARDFEEASGSSVSVEVKPKRVKPLLVDGRPPQPAAAGASGGTLASGGMLALPRRNMDELGSPNGNLALPRRDLEEMGRQSSAGMPAARSGIRPESLAVDRL